MRYGGTPGGGSGHQQEAHNEETLTAAAFLAAIALPATATGGESNERARGSQFTISYTLLTVDGDPQELRRFRFAGVKAPCESGGSATVSGRLGTIPVRPNNRFGAILLRNGKRVRVAGEVKPSKVVGTIRVSGDFGERTGCDSGRLRWVAS